MIEVAHVSKSFKIYKNTKDSKHKLRSLFAREYEIKRAVDDVSFTVGDGELVGYVGPNGAGKSTTIKMLSGILTPTAGRFSASRAALPKTWEGRFFCAEGGGENLEVNTP